MGSFKFQCYNCQGFDHIAKDCKKQGFTKIWRKKSVDSINMRLRDLVHKNTRLWKQRSMEKPSTEAVQDNKSKDKELDHEDHERYSILF